MKRNEQKIENTWRTEDIFKDLLKINENISGTSNVVSSIMEYTLNRQLLINGESDLQTSIFYTFYNA